MRVRFLGISTAGSAIHRVFPAWMDLLGLDVALEGVDLPADAAPEAYSRFVVELRDDPDVLGAVITSHKLGVYRAAHDLLTAADQHVELLREINAIAAGDMTAHARDVLAVTAALPTSGPVGEALVLGAGGAGTAIVLALLARRPARITVTDTRRERLAALREVLDRIAAREVALLPAAEAEQALAALPAGALVVNATGLGKDAPGSPVSGRFPAGAIVWDANYRGELAFLAHARAQGGLHVHDGFEYFVHGWAEALTPILGVPLDRRALAEVAARMR
jgi:shikimate 5-dehydrogenase